MIGLLLGSAEQDGYDNKGRSSIMCQWVYRPCAFLKINVTPITNQTNLGPPICLADWQQLQPVPSSVNANALTLIKIPAIGFLQYSIQSL